MITTEEKLELQKLPETDKGTTHAYINEFYGPKIFKNKDRIKNIFEIGVDQGGSIKLWYEECTNAQIEMVDVIHKPNINLPRLTLYRSDAYIPEFVDNLKNTYDLIIDDGCHHLEDQIKCAQVYTKLLNPGGYLVIEDIAKIEYVDQIIKAFPEELRQYVKVYDLRNVKRRFDDILVVLHLPND
tara:strand:- start:146 stop:697 length:552 start_codon:yes stop_codon:yes gene_type:complete